MASEPDEDGALRAIEDGASDAVESGAPDAALDAAPTAPAGAAANSVRLDTTSRLEIREDAARALSYQGSVERRGDEAFLALSPVGSKGENGKWSMAFAPPSPFGDER